jgi:ZIP family zinc transporter
MIMGAHSGVIDPALWCFDPVVLANHSPAALWAGVLLGVIAALATMIGWLMAAARRSWPASVQASGLVFAAAAMIGLSLLGMVPDARESGLSAWAVTWLFLLGCAIALATLLLARRIVTTHTPLARTALVVAVVIALHNIPEGSITVGVAMLSLDAAVLTMVVIALQNVPEGLAVATPVIVSGGSRLRAFVLTAIATAGEILGVLLAARYTAVMTPVSVGTLLAMVAGVMFTISAVELAPAALRILLHKGSSAYVEARHTRGLPKPAAR